MSTAPPPVVPPVCRTHDLPRSRSRPTGRTIADWQGDDGAQPVRVVVTVAHARVMHGAIAGLVHRARRDLDRSGDPRANVVVDLSELPAVLGTQICAPLTKLLELLKGMVGPAGVSVTGAASTLRPCLVAGLPDGVQVIDRTGRSWPA